MNALLPACLVGIAPAAAELLEEAAALELKAEGASQYSHDHTFVCGRAYLAADAEPLAEDALALAVAELPPLLTEAVADAAVVVAAAAEEMLLRATVAPLATRLPSVASPTSSLPMSADWPGRSVLPSTFAYPPEMVTPYTPWSAAVNCPV
jgi:hypothetical protein